MKKMTMLIVVSAILALILGAITAGCKGTDNTDQNRISNLSVQTLGNVVITEGTIKPTKRAELSFQIGGQVTMLPVSLGDQVKKGEMLVSLSNEEENGIVEQAEAALLAAKANLDHTIAQQAQIESVDDNSRPIERARAKIEAQDAIETFLHVSGTNDTAATLSPQGLLKMAQRLSTLASAKLSALDAEKTHQDALDFYGITQDAVDQVNVALNNLNTAQRNLTAAKITHKDKLDDAQEVFNEAKNDYRNIYLKWLGISATSDELTHSPKELLSLWKIDLDYVFDWHNVAQGYGGATDDPTTVWDEQIIFAWIYLHPLSGTFQTNCDTSSSTSQAICIEKELDDTWEQLTEATEQLQLARADGQTAVASAENNILKMQEILQAAEDSQMTLDAERLALNASFFQAQLDSAEGVVLELEKWPNPDEIALSKAELKEAERLLAKLDAGRDPFDKELSDALIAVAEADVASAQANLRVARARQSKLELRAPFSGIVASLKINIGQEVIPGTVIVRMADTSKWEIETADLDEISVVNLKQGENVIVKIDALPEIELVGTVAKISGFGEEKHGAITYTAVVNIPSSDDRLLWNMTASIHKNQPEAHSGINRSVQTPK